MNGCRKVGIGYSIARHNEEICHKSSNIGPRAEVNDAEMLAIVLAAKKVDPYAIQHNVRHISFNSDNITPVQTIQTHPSTLLNSAPAFFRNEVNRFLAHHPEITK